MFRQWSWILFLWRHTHSSREIPRCTRKILFQPRPTVSALSNLQPCDSWVGSVGRALLLSNVYGDFTKIGSTFAVETYVHMEALLLRTDQMSTCRDNTWVICQFRREQSLWRAEQCHSWCWILGCCRNAALVSRPASSSGQPHSSVVHAANIQSDTFPWCRDSGW